MSWAGNPNGNAPVGQGLLGVCDREGAEMEHGSGERSVRGPEVGVDRIGEVIGRAGASRGNHRDGGPIRRPSW